MKSLDSDPPRSLSRRELLSAATALSVAATTFPTNSLEAAPARRNGGSRGPRTDFDVIVVGGGFAGVTAARDCARSGMRTLLLEAKNRLGGRTFDTQFRGHHVELGGTWVHPTQAAVWTEIMRYGLESDIEETPGAVPERMIAIVNGKPVEVGDPAQIAQVMEGLTAFYEEAPKLWARPYGDPHDQMGAITAADRLSAADHLATLSLNPLQKAVVTSFVESLAHCPMEQVSYVEQMRAWTMLQNNVGIAFDAVVRYKLKSGTGNLIKHMIADGTATVKLASAVTRIEQKGTETIVSFGKSESASAGSVILAVPLRVWSSIEFSPPLSADKKAASETAFTTSGCKYYAEVAGKLGKIQCFASAKDSPAGTVFTYNNDSDNTLLVGFSALATGFDATDEDAMQAALRRFIPDIRVLSCTSYAWAQDPYARGTYSGFKPGYASRLGESICKPEGRIFMAGSDAGFAANSYRLFITGAIESGARAAQQVHRTMS